MIIGVNPDSLRRSAQYFAAASRVLNEIGQQVQPAYQNLEWEVKDRANLQSAIDQITTRSRQLAAQAEAMAYTLLAAAAKFEELDKRGGAEFNSVGNPAVDALRTIMQGTPLATLPAPVLQQILELGNLFDYASRAGGSAAASAQQALQNWIGGTSLPNLQFSHKGGASHQINLNWNNSGSFSTQLPGGANLSVANLLNNAGTAASNALGQADADMIRRVQQAVGGIPEPMLAGLLASTLPQAGQISGALDGAVRGRLQDLTENLLKQLPPQTLKGAAHFGGTLFSGRVGDQNNFISATLLEAAADVRGELHADLAKGQLSASADLKAAVTLFDIQAKGGFAVGDSRWGISANGQGRIRAGATAEAHGELRMDLGKGQIGAQGSFQAFAGAEATAEGTASAALAGVQVTANGRASAMVGVGVKAEGRLGFEGGKLQIGFDLGASVVVGAGVGFDVKLDPRQMAQDVQNAVQGAANAVGNAVGGATQAAADFGQNVVSTVTSWIPKWPW